MPSFDGGHYFLTVLAPVLADPVTRADGSVTSPAAALREALACLPTAEQSEACVDTGHGSPFSRCTRTHFVRLAVIDQPAFNGRDPGNSLVEAVRKTDLLAHQPIDGMTRAWLLLAIDFDADVRPEADADHGRRAYLAGLWGLMAPELTDIFRFCHGFDRVADADGFARYVERCEVETTMPFNDYWTVPFAPPTLSLGGLGAVVAGVAAIAMLLAWGATRLLDTGAAWAFAALPVAIALGLFAAYRFASGRGARPFPAAPSSDLRSILKALHLQQGFARFAAARQGASPAALHAAFGDFAARYRPDDIAQPTQAPGMIRS